MYAGSCMLCVVTKSPCMYSVVLFRDAWAVLGPQRAPPPLETCDRIRGTLLLCCAVYVHMYVWHSSRVNLVCIISASVTVANVDTGAILFPQSHFLEPCTFHITLHYLSTIISWSRAHFMLPNFNGQSSVGSTNCGNATCLYRYNPNKCGMSLQVNGCSSVL